MQAVAAVGAGFGDVCRKDVPVPAALRLYSPVPHL